MKGLQSIYNILIFLFGGITFLFLLYLFFHTAPFMKGFLDMTTIGQIGDFIGGFLGTILTGITLILLIWSNREQGKAFEKEFSHLQKQFDEQKEQFEFQANNSIFLFNYQMVKDTIDYQQEKKELEIQCLRIEYLADWLRARSESEVIEEYSNTLYRIENADYGFKFLSPIYNSLFYAFSEGNHSIHQKHIINHLVFKNSNLLKVKEALPKLSVLLTNELILKLEAIGEERGDFSIGSVQRVVKYSSDWYTLLVASF